MPNFVDDPVTLAGPKTVKKPVPGGEDVNKYIRAVDFNEHRQALLDVRDRLIEHGGDITTLDGLIAALTTRVGALESALGVSSGSIFIGNGDDGNVTLDGVSTVLGMVPVAGVYTMTRHMFFLNLTFSAANVRLNTNGWIPYVQEEITPHASGSYISSNGGDASGLTAGVTAISAATGGPLRNAWSGAGGNGSTSWSTAPANGLGSDFAPKVFTAGFASSPAGTLAGQHGANGSDGAPGQAGGAGAPGSNGPNSVAGSAQSGIVTLHTSTRDIREGWNAIDGTPQRGAQGWTGGTGGGGGRGGFDGPANNSGAGGGGGAGGGYLVLLVKKINDAANLHVQTNGGNGGNAVAGFSGAGGPGGGGGLCVVGIGEGDFPDMQANGGTGGPGATGSVSGLHGGNGGNGGPGKDFPLRL